MPGFKKESLVVIGLTSNNVNVEFNLHENEHASKTNFHRNGFAQGLVLKQRQKTTQKWPIRASETELFPIQNIGHRPSSVAGVLGVTGTLSAGADSPFSSDLFLFFPGVAIVESVAGLYAITTLVNKKTKEKSEETASYPTYIGALHVHVLGEWGGTGGCRNQGVRGVGSLQEEGEERVGSRNTKVAGTGRNRKTFPNIA